MQIIGVTHIEATHAQVIIHNGVTKKHTTIIDTGSQKSMIGLGKWEIIKCHDIWIDSQGVDIGRSSKEGVNCILLTQGVWLEIVLIVNSTW